VDFTPNPERKHTRGRRGKVFSGISDLQADFEMDRVRDDRGAQRAVGRARGFAKQKRATKRERIVRAFRGKDSKNKPLKEVRRGPARAQFIADKARKRRVLYGLEGKSRRQQRLTRPDKSIGLFNLKAAVLQFKRTGKLPFKSVDEIRMMDVSGVDADALKRMIQRMLVRSGVEENPGPKHEVGSTSSSSTDVTYPPVAHIVKRKKEKEVLTSLSSPSCSSSTKMSSEKFKCDRHHEKVDNCGGNKPGDDDRIKWKKSTSKKNFRSASLLTQAGMTESAKAAGQVDADGERAKEEERRKDQSIKDSYAEARRPFVMRAGGFARPWYSGFGVPKTTPQLLLAMLTYLKVWFQFIRGLGEMPLWDPREGDVWKECCKEDEEYATPVFKGLVMSTALVGVAAGVGLGCFIFTWLCSFSSLVTVIGIFLDWFLKSMLFVQLFAMLFRPVLRYVAGDCMYEVGSPHFWDEDPNFDPTMRMPGARFRAAIDRAVLADVPVHKITVIDDTPWWKKHMAVSWLFGSLFGWIDFNRLIRLQHTRAIYVVSMRLADAIADAFTRTRLDSYWEAEGKARNIASTYDELKLGTHIVNGRQVKEDTICYAAALYWSRAAADATLGNVASPQSE
jgi:hypothetical protein